MHKVSHIVTFSVDINAEGSSAYRRITTHLQIRSVKAVDEIQVQNRRLRMRRSSTILAFLLAFLGVAAVCHGIPVHSSVRHVKDGVTDHGKHTTPADSAGEKPRKLQKQEEGADNSSDGMEMSESDMGADMNSEDTSTGDSSESTEMTEPDMDSEDSSADDGGQNAEATETSTDSDDSTGDSDGAEVSEPDTDSHDHSTHDHAGEEEGEQEEEEHPDEEGSHEHMSGDDEKAETIAGAHNEESEATSNEPEESPAVESGVCIGADMLSRFAGHELVFEKHILARVLCDAAGSCATKGHIVNFKGKSMMMSSYCDIVGCNESVMEVNSPKYRHGLRIPSVSENMHFTAFAARFETRGEEAVLSAAVHMGL